MTKYIIIVLFAIASIVFASVLVRYSEAGPIASGGYRLLLAIPFLLLIDISKPKLEHLEFNLKIFYSAIFAGIFFALDLAFYNVALMHTSMAEANLLTNMVPFVIAPISVLFFKEKISPKFIITVLLAILGLHFLMSEAGENSSHLTGNWMALLSAVFYAFFLISIKKASTNYYVCRVMGITCLSGAILLFAIAYFKAEILLPSSAHGWLVILGIVFSGQILGQTLLAHGIKFLPLQLASLFLLLSPVFAAIYALILFNERLSIMQLLGITIILVAVYYGKKILDNNSKQKNL